MIAGAQPIFFSTPSDFRNWLAENHDKVPELIVGYHKVGSGQPSMKWSESVDQAICFGWIDGVRQSIDHESYFIRFTPRKPGSNWSTINIKKVEALTAKGLIQPSGIAAFKLSRESKSGIYSYEKEPVKLTDKYENIFKENMRAWFNFSEMPKSYKNTAIHWVMSAKQEATSERRLEELMIASEAGRKPKSFSYKKNIP